MQIHTMILIYRHIKKLQITGITLFPFIILRSKELKQNPVLLNHERIHLKQQLELLILPFYIWYLVEYLILRTRMSHQKAYRSIVFEKEAYAMDKDLAYIKQRRPFAFLKFYRRQR